MVKVELLACTFIVLLALPFGVDAQMEQSIVVGAKETNNGPSSEAAEGGSRAPDPSLLVERKINNFLDSSSMDTLRSRQEQGEAYIGYGISGVQVGVNDPSWGKHRVIAYERAFLNAQDRFLEYQTVSQSTELIRSFSTEPTAGLPEFEEREGIDDSALGRVLHKLGAALEGELDQKLEELDIDPHEFESAPVTQRKQLLKAGITKEAVKKSIGTLVGLVPIRTFEGHNTQGEHAVGVVVVYTPKLREVAKSISAGQGQTLNEGQPGVTLSKLVKGNDASIHEDFGVRIVYDENGQPALLSFGQWSPSVKTEDPALNRQYSRIAQQQARNLADGYITLFLNSSAMYEESSTVGDMIEHYYEVDSSGFVAEKVAKEIRDEIRKQSRVRGKTLIVGLRDLYKWTKKHPTTGHTVTGVVRVWTPDSQRAARKVNKERPDLEVRQSEKDAVKGQSEDIVTESNTYMNPDNL